MATDQPQTTPAKDRVPWSQLIAYGMGGIVPVALFNIAGQLMGLLGNISLGLSAFWLGTIMIVPRLWDAISDPIIGHLSDNTRTRWGRRRPYILVGGIAVALSFVAMWWVPRGEWIREFFPSERGFVWFQLIYILGGLLVFFTACTMFEIPHGALGMEMSGDYHERTRLFSAKSFLGNLFAMGTPWLILLAGLPFFSGVGGDFVDGMRYVSLFLAALLIPMSIWWFVVLREPGFAVAKQQEKSTLWSDIRTTVGSRSFLILVGIIFTLAMGFNFVALFNYYITIFYLFGGDAVAASKLLGINGTAWAVTGLVAVFPLNWLSKRIGKNYTLIIAILQMCAAQLSKIVCYDPQHPYLLLIPTVLLSSGMLMFFTLGSSMVGDICDEDELKTGSRSEGSFYSVYWWFIKMGSAFASFVTGALLVLTAFDERQNVYVTQLRGDVETIRVDAESWKDSKIDAAARLATFDKHTQELIEQLEKLKSHFELRRQSNSEPLNRDGKFDEIRASIVEWINRSPDQTAHTARLIEQTNNLLVRAKTFQSHGAALVKEPARIVDETSSLLGQVTELKKQTSTTLFRLRLIEIGLPLALSSISIVLTLRYPLTEERWRQIKAELQRRHANAGE